MSKIIINTNDAPAPIGPYNQAISFGNVLYTSGQIAINPKTNELEIGDIQSETLVVMQNVKAVVEAAGFEMKDIVKTTIFIMDMGQFAAINEVYGSFFESDFPARETVQVAGLPKGVNVEISVVAMK